MLYLMMDKTDKEFLVKVGFSDGETTRRRRQYRSYNPRAIMRSSCAGSTSMEKRCHQDLAKWGRPANWRDRVVRGIKRTI